MVCYVQIAKSGDSLVISLPREIRDALGLAHRDRLRLEVAGELLLIAREDPNEDARRSLARKVVR